MAVTEQERAHIGLSPLLHLHWDTAVLSFVREKQRNWMLSNFMIYVSVFQVVFAIWKVSQPGLPEQSFQEKLETMWTIILEPPIVLYDGDNSLGTFSPRSLTFPQRTAVLLMVPCAREAVADVILPSLLAALQRVLLPGLLKQSHCREMVLTLWSHWWVLRSRAEHRSSGDSWFCIFSNMGVQWQQYLVIHVNKVLNSFDFRR